MDKFLFGGASWSEAKSALDAGTLRQRTIAENIAHARTPGYRSQEVRFEELLSRAEQGARGMKQTRDGHMKKSEGSAVAPRPEVVFSRQAEVDIEREMVSLNENSIHYRAIAQMVARRYRGLRNAIRTEG